MEKRAGYRMVSKGKIIVEPTPIRYYSISSTKAIANGLRIDASTYQALGAIRTIKSNPYGWVYLWSDEGMILKAFVGNRFKRIYTENQEDIPFFLPSDIEDLYPLARKHISPKTKTDINKLRVNKNMLLITVSGTIGKTSLVSNKLVGQVFSHDLLRVVFKKDYYLGYVYAFLKTETGLKALQANNYGAVIDHIEPEHLRNVPIPNPPEEVKKEIHDLVVRSYELRDESNDLMEQAQNLLYEALGLPRRVKPQPEYYAQEAGFRNFSVNSSRLNARLDTSYHLPEIDEIVHLISKNAKEVTTLGDPRITKAITLPGRFKRVYVDKEYGVLFLAERSCSV